MDPWNPGSGLPLTWDFSRGRSRHPLAVGTDESSCWVRSSCFNHPERGVCSRPDPHRLTWPRPTCSVGSWKHPEDEEDHEGGSVGRASPVQRGAPRAPLKGQAVAVLTSGCASVCCLESRDD